MAESIASRLLAVEEKIAAACERAGRARSEVTLVAVSKTFPAAAIDEVIAAGATDIGENRVQEAQEKFLDVDGKARFHLIGHLQSNKSKVASSLFDVVQTVDSVKLGRRLHEAREETGAPLEVLVQVNVGEEEQKYGVPAGEALELVAELAQFEYLKVTGLMTIPPIADERATRTYFTRLRNLRDEIRSRNDIGGFAELSMGMSSDYEIAIEEGATIIRVGSAIFGSRD